MSDELQRYIDRRANNWEGMKVLLDASKTRDLSAEEQSEWDKREAEIDSDGKMIERIERAVKLEGLNQKKADELQGREMGKKEITDDEKYERAFSEYLLRGERVSPESRELLETRGTNPQGVLQPWGDSTGGGYTVPPGFLVRLTETMKAYGGLINYMEALNTSSGNSLQFPTHDGTAEVGAIIAEQTGDTVADTTFGTKTIGAYMYTSNILKASVELLQDSAFNLDSWLPGRLGERIGRALAAHAATGNGTTQPEGIATNVTTGVTAVSTTAFTVNEVVDLIHSVDPAYRELNPAFYCNDSVVKFARKLLDTTGRPIWEPSIQAGAPSSLYGYPVRVAQNLASAMTTGQKVLFFGNLERAFIHRFVSGAQVVTLRELYAANRQVGYMAFERHDQKANDPAALRVLKLA